MRLFFFLAFLVTSLPSFSQIPAQVRADSLQKVLAATPDNTAKVDTYVKLIFTYNDFDRVKALEVSEPALALAEALRYKSGIAHVKNGIGRVHWRNGNYEKSLPFHHEAKALFEELNDKSKVANTIRYIGQNYADAGNYSEALKYFYESLERYTLLNDRLNMGHCYNLLSWVYGKQGNYLEAVKKGYECLSLFEQAGSEVDIASAAADIAENYLHLGNYDEALTYFKKSIETSAALGDLINLGYSYNLLGKVYRITTQYTESLQAYQKGFEIGQKVNDISIMGFSYQGMAEVFSQTKEYRKSLEHYLEAERLFQKGGNKKEQAQTYCKIGACYRILSDFDLSRLYYDSALQISKEVASRVVMADYYKGMEKLDSTMGNWQSAYSFHKKYIANQDSIFNQDIVQKMVQLKMEYDFEKKEAASLAAQEQKDSRLQLQLASSITIAFLILVLAIVLYRGRERIAGINKALKQKSQSLEEENREKNSILNIVSHDLRAPFNKIKGLTDLMKLGRQAEEDKKEYWMHIDASIEQGKYLINKLLEAQAFVHEEQQPHCSPVNIQSFLHNFELTFNAQLETKQQKLATHLKMSPLEIHTDEQMLMRILDNLVSNASKFSEKGKTIFLTVGLEAQHIYFAVRDEGPGISEEDQKHLFKKFQKLSARPTGGEGSTGLGLSITKALIDKLHGTIQVKSKLKEGTEIIVSLPYTK